MASLAEAGELDAIIVEWDIPERVKSIARHQARVATHAYREVPYRARKLCAMSADADGAARKYTPMRVFRFGKEAIFVCGNETFIFGGSAFNDLQATLRRSWAGAISAYHARVREGATASWAWSQYRRLRREAGESVDIALELGQIWRLGNIASWLRKHLQFFREPGRDRSCF